jgi:hypothetical protein
MNEANFSLDASDMIIESKEPQPVERLSTGLVKLRKDEYSSKTNAH